MVPTASSATSASTSLITTDAPLRASSVAYASPSPRPLPVTIATLPDRSTGAPHRDGGWCRERRWVSWRLSTMEVCMGQPLADDLGFLLSRASGQIVRATNAALAEHGLRVRQYSVLALACESEDGLSQRELATALGLDPSQVVLLVDELAAAGLVERQAPEADRRTRLVVVTREGRRVREAARR